VIDGPEADVEVLDNSFNDENIQVAPGTKVVWTNDGRQDHDIVPAEGDGFGVEPDDFGPDAVYEHTFDEPGTYRYYCSLHGTPVAGMVGAIVVKE
jgi:plastocyanin